MSKYENNPEEFLNELSDEEFRQLLLRAGFDVEDGDGSIIFTDNFNDFEWQEEGTTFRMNQTYNFKVKKKEKIMYQPPMKIA